MKGAQNTAQRPCCNANLAEIMNLGGHPNPDMRTCASTYALPQLIAKASLSSYGCRSTNVMMAVREHCYSLGT